MRCLSSQTLPDTVLVGLLETDESDDGYPEEEEEDKELDVGEEMELTQDVAIGIV